MNSIEFPEMNYKHFREKNAKFHIFLLLSIMGGISLITIYDRKFRHNRPEEGLPKMITYISPINPLWVIWWRNLPVSDCRWKIPSLSPFSTRYLSLPRSDESASLAPTVVMTFPIDASGDTTLKNSSEHHTGALSLKSSTAIKRNVHKNKNNRNWIFSLSE